MVMQPIAVTTAILCLAAGAAGGYALKDRMAQADIERLRADMARVEASHAEERRAAMEEAALRMAAAEEAQASAVRALHATKSQLAATQRRLKETLYGLPTSGGCGLSGAARGLLNAAIAGDAMPAGSAGADRADAAAAADPVQPPASESDVGAWIADAVALYDECRARLDAIRQWDDDVSVVAHGR